MPAHHSIETTRIHNAIRRLPRRRLPSDAASHKHGPATMKGRMETAEYMATMPAGFQMGATVFVKLRNTFVNTIGNRFGGPSTRKKLIVAAIAVVQDNKSA